MALLADRPDTLAERLAPRETAGIPVERVLAEFEGNFGYAFYILFSKPDYKCPCAEKAVEEIAITMAMRGRWSVLDSKED